MKTMLTLVASSWTAANSVSAGRWTEASAKTSSHVSTLNSEKWSGNKNSESLAQESEGKSLISEIKIQKQFDLYSSFI